MKTKTTIYAKKTVVGDWAMFKHGSHEKIHRPNLSRVMKGASGLIDDREHVVAIKIEVSRKGKTKTIIYAKKTGAGEWVMLKHGSQKKIFSPTLWRALRDVSTLIDDREHVVALKIEVSRKKEL